MQINNQTYFVKQAVEGNDYYLIFKDKTENKYYLWNRGGRYIEGEYDDIATAEKAMESFSEN